MSTVTVKHTHNIHPHTYLAKAHIDSDNEALPNGVAAGIVHVVVLLVSPLHFCCLSTCPLQMSVWQVKRVGKWGQVSARNVLLQLKSRFVPSPCQPSATKLVQVRCRPACASLPHARVLAALMCRCVRVWTCGGHGHHVREYFHTLCLFPVSWCATRKGVSGGGEMRGGGERRESGEREGRERQEERPEETYSRVQGRPPQRRNYLEREVLGEQDKAHRAIYVHHHKRQDRRLPPRSQKLQNLSRQRLIQALRRQKG